MKPLRLGCLTLAACILLTGWVAAFEVREEKEYVQLELPVQQSREFRVWHTANPMKVIVDLDWVVPELHGTSEYEDIALEKVRASERPDAEGTRLVMDFKYQLPEPSYTVEDGQLLVRVDKVFNWASESGISQGVRYGHQRRGSAAGPLIVNYLKARITDPDIEFSSVLARDEVFERELVSSMADRSQAIAAVNGAYFAPDGRPLGVLAIDGQLVSEPFAKRTAIGLGKNTVVMGSVDSNGFVETAHGRMDITGMNRPRMQDDLIVYTSHYGSATETNVYGLDVLVRNGRVEAVQEGSMDIPEDGVVLSGHGAGRDFLMGLQPGDEADWHVALEPNWFDEGITEIIGGGPRIVKDGEVYISGEIERFQRDITRGRAPRTALGITEDDRLLIVTVNGRNPNISVGMTLEELADLMLELGAVDAMNLDGGGSTTMIVRNRILNIPSDGVERKVSNALVISTPESRK